MYRTNKSSRANSAAGSIAVARTNAFLGNLRQQMHSVRGPVGDLSSAVVYGKHKVHLP